MPSQISPAIRSPRGSAKTAKTSKTPKPKVARRSEIVAALIDPERRRSLIAEAAYFRAQRRNFASGFEVEDWLSAESDVDTALTLGVLPSDN